MHEYATGRIKITRVPTGEAPFEIRKAWVGLELPCLPICGFFGEEYGVLTNAPLPSTYGFSVLQCDALEILEKERPEAAKWWKDKDFPLSGDGEFFKFAENEAEIISGVELQQLIRLDNTEDGYYRTVPPDI